MAAAQEMLMPLDNLVQLMLRKTAEFGFGGR